MWKFLGIIVYFYTIYEVVSSRFANSNDKLIWVLIVLLLPLLGTILWFAVGRNKRL
ncbi:hypothetical protein D0X99_01535 [Algoriphagus lacus]|uniref:Cardiolipin synthase N-terminal domain-containing protein n=1 Tax=Algoriphagus lacus TaxID=2056311 RepID=A0A418PWF8_9BACT|nr:PLDc N-terminal domain-containing protein [Algoriphagus lacus]RIW18396.1 hypothetical protein D0X99_01535 [Algoriphagus lacus]